MPNDLVPEGFRSGFANKPEKRQCITDGNVIRAIPERMPIPEGWTRGQPKGRFKWITNGTECRRLHTGDPMPDGFRIVTDEYHSTKGKTAITDGKTTVFINPGDPVPDGWRIGSSNKTVKDKKYYNNGVIQKAFREGEPVPDGWMKGKLCFTFINNGSVVKKLVKGMPMPEGFVVGKIKKKTGVKQQG